jgi:hypothetical protein
VNREAQITTVLILGFAVAFLGWAIVYLASAPVHPHEDDATWTPFRRRIVEDMRRRKGTTTAEHLKFALSVIDGPHFLAKER